MKKLISVFDKAAMFYKSPIVVNHQNEALRIFESAMRTKGSDFSQYPNDYDLYLIGEFDEVTGTLIQTQDQPQRIISGLQMVKNIETLEREHMDDRLSQIAEEEAKKKTEEESIFDKNLKNEEYQHTIQEQLNRQELGTHE